jgi:hypothetical protein
MSTSDTLTSEISAKAKEIHTDAYPMSIGELISIYRDEELDIHPEFQRFFRWTDLQKSKFIESILLGIPIPSIFVSQREDGVWDVVDGVQRLSTIFEFTGVLRDKDGFPKKPSVLVGTDYLPCLEGMVWEDARKPAKSFSNAVRLEFKRQKLDLKIIKKESDEKTKYDLFERLNTLGSKLSDQEVRNCLLVMVNPDMYHWLESLSQFGKFQEAISLSEKALQERYDMELALRFLLLTRVEDTKLQKVKDVDAFITEGMRDMATDKTFNFESEETVFKTAFSKMRDVLDANCFTRIDQGKGRGGFLISVFEVVAVGLGQRIRHAPAKCVDAHRLEAAYKSVPSDSTFKEYSRSGKSASSRMPRLVPLGRKIFKAV